MSEEDKANLKELDAEKRKQSADYRKIFDAVNRKAKEAALEGSYVVL